MDATKQAHKPLSAKKALPLPPEGILALHFGKSSKNFSPKVWQALLGPVEAQLLQALWHALESLKVATETGRQQSILKVVEDEDGILWVRASRAELAGHVVCAKATLFANEGIVPRLADLGLIQCRAYRDTSLWRVNHERLLLMTILGYILYACQKEQDWLSFVESNRQLVEPFVFQRGGIWVSLFPSCSTPAMLGDGVKPKAFKNRTPFVVSKTEQTLCDTLIKCFKTHEIWDKNSNSTPEKLVGHHTTTGWAPTDSGWAPYHHWLGTIPDEGG